MIRININTENAVFDLDPARAVARLLEDVTAELIADGLPEDGESRPIIDPNGHRVGQIVNERI